MTTSTRLRGAAFAAAAGLLGVACAGGSDDASPASTAEVQQSAATTPPVTAPESAPIGDVPGILQFTSALVGGGELDAAALAGKPTAFWFWSPT